jgi:Ni,Fe-hydrogenase III small subunit/NAD-dependent dihydropyrimidine dehydrogenase PreA subunit
MLNILRARFKQGHRTVAFPDGEPVLPDKFRGAPMLDRGRCQGGCAKCAEVCPVGAIQGGKEALQLDMGRCLFCGECEKACPAGAVTFSRDWRLSARKREDLVAQGAERKLALALDEKMRSLFGRSLKLRQVSAGGCNACEADTNVLNTVVFDLGRFGIQFVASPRHADGLLVTGPVPKNMRLALEKTYAAVPAPKIVIAVGACAISGGPYLDQPETLNGASSIVPVDLFIPGCPPHPYTILDGLLRLVGQLEERGSGDSHPPLGDTPDGK